LSTDGHGEISMPPYNFVAGGIIKTKTGSNLLSVSILSLRIIRLNKPSSKSHKTFGQQAPEKKKRVVFRVYDNLGCVS
jgi:hypothetical protein